MVLLALAVVAKHWALKREQKRQSQAKAQYAPVIQVDISCAPRGMMGEARPLGGDV